MIAFEQQQTISSHSSAQSASTSHNEARVAHAAEIRKMMMRLFPELFGCQFTLRAGISRCVRYV